MKRLFSSGQSAAAMAIGLVLALCGTTYATGLSESSGRSSATSATDGGAATYSVLGRSFAYFYGSDIPLRTLPETRYSQVNLMSSGAGMANGGTITLAERGQIHANASVVLVRRPGAGGAASCDLRLNGQGISSPFTTTFSDAGSDFDGGPAWPTVTVSVTGSLDDLEPGTYNVGVRCWNDRADLVKMTRAELTTVVYSS